MAEITVRLTKDNITTALKPGDRFADDLEFGTVRSARLTWDGEENAMVYTDKGKDVLGLPSTVRLIRG